MQLVICSVSSVMLFFLAIADGAMITSFRCANLADLTRNLH